MLMTPAQNLYDPKYCGWRDAAWTKSGRYFEAPTDYQPLLDSMPAEILIQVDDDDYQGDTRILFDNGRMELGVLIFGWGSCSGCDELQDCSDWGQVEFLRGKLWGSVRWFSKHDDLRKWIAEAEERNEFSYHQKETREFYRQVLTYLDKQRGGE